MPINVFTTLDDPSGVYTTASGINAEVPTAAIDKSFAEQQR
jgi:hypothetical protein